MKNLTCSLLILSLVLLISTAGYAQEETDIETLRAADVNKDGTINILDLVLVASHIGETIAEDQTPNPDVNADGSINILDLVLVASHLSKTVRPPVVFVRSAPEIGSELDLNGRITLTFNNPPTDVTVSTGVATTEGNIVNITGPFTPGELALTITWADGTQILSYAIRQPAAFVSADPESGEVIPTNDSITLTFDNPPEDVNVSTGTATTDGNTVNITGPFTPGELELTITWADGTETLAYTIRPFVAFVSADPESGVEITTNDSITLTFDNPPADVNVSTGTATTDGNTVNITGPFTPSELALTITWADGTQTLSYTVRPFVTFVGADPQSGVEITTNDSITLTFDNPPEDVTVSTGTATTDGNTATITGPFTPGELALTITWADGTQTLSYTVRPFVTFVGADPESGVEITTNDSITLTFDNPPADVTVSTGVALTEGNTVNITGPFTPGELALTITWADGTEMLSYTVRPLVAYLSVDPTVDSVLTVDGSIIVTFDNPPGDVTVNTGTATIDGNTATITGPFTPGDLELIITWSDGSLPFTYTVAEPDTEAPSITGGTVSDGDTDVDRRETIEIAFSEEVTGTITLQTEAGEDVGWKGTVEGDTATLELVEGKELGTGTEYVIAGTVEDAAGNETEINITFTTESLTSGVPIEVTEANFDTVVLGSEVPIVVEFYTDW